MSKLGKKPISIPKDAKIKFESGKLILTGPKGSRELSLNDKIFSTTISEDNNLILKLIKKNESSNVIWGTTRSIIKHLNQINTNIHVTMQLYDISTHTMITQT